MTIHNHSATSRFFKAFTAAINWNALFYIVYKICFVTLTFVLYKVLPSSYFSQWATANSIIFIFLLWINFGFKKSIPRFAPVFSRDYAFHRAFIIALLAFKTCILIVGIPILVKILAWFSPNLPFLPLVIGIFATEGLCSLFLLIYHAHFWQKQFNLIQALFLLIEMILSFSYLFFFSATPNGIVSFLFFAKLVGNLGIICLSLVLLPSLYRTALLPSSETIDKKGSIRAFIKHSCAMWMVAILQSISERNFLFPFITSVQGQTIGNIFKVTHDAAIFFQRIALQTIGIADTALLSYVEVTDKRPSQIRLAFRTIFKTVFLLCIPLLCVGIFLFFKNYTDVPSSSAFLFLFIALGTTLEIILSPYARVLEVKLCYKELFFSYFPYALAYGVLCILYAHSVISLVLFVSAAHVIRIMGALIMVYCAKKDFRVQLPSFFVSLVVLLCAAVLLLALLFA